MRIIALLILLAVIVLGPTRGASADPARWLIRDKDTTIILFGTLHVLKPGTPWLSRVMREDLKQVQTLFLEVAPEETDPARMAPLIQRYGLLKKPVPLNDRVGDAMTLMTKQAALDLGLDPRPFDAMRPWLISASLTTASFSAVGYKDDNGVETTLTKLVSAAGGKVMGLESIETQISIFGGLSAEEEQLVLSDTLSQIKDAEGFMDRLTSAYVAGDIKAVSAILNTSFEATPGLYEKVIAKRNLDWALKIETLLGEPGVFAIAVGAGHFGGRDTLLDYLDLLAIKVDRLAR